MEQLLEETYRAEREHFWFKGFRQFIAPLVDRALAGRPAPGCSTAAAAPAPTSISSIPL